MFFFFFDENEGKKSVPGFELTMKPILMALQEKGGKATIAELDDLVMKIMDLPEDIIRIKHKDSGRQSEVEYRIAWGRTYLKKYGLIKNISRGVWKLTDRFDGNIEKIDVDEIVRKVRNDNADSKTDKEGMTGFESASAFENMVGALLKELAKKEGKQVHYAYSDSGNSEYDMILPNGLEEDQEEIKCFIEYVNLSRQNEYDNFYDRMMEKFGACLGNGKIMFITNISVPEATKNKFGQGIIVWDKEDLLERIEPEAPYAQYLINPQQAFIEDVVGAKNSVAQKSMEREKYIKQVKNAFRKGDVVLFLGAGVSIDGGLPLWGTLIKTLHISMLNELIKDKDLSFKQKEMMREIASDNEMESPLMQMRYIRSGFSDEEYYRLVHSALYEKNINLDTKLLNSIAKICMPQREYNGVKSIITYNFDDLVERKLAQKDVRYNIIASEEDRQLWGRLNIYHVHGYLPSDYVEVSDEPNLIFSEEDYHRIYRDAYSWSNLVQLNVLRENTCLFIGCSLTDPNLRRLLDVAARNGETPRHYAFLKKKKINKQKNGRVVNEDVLGIYQRIDDNIQTAYYKKMGLNIIWIEDFGEIPDILNGFLD